MLWEQKATPIYRENPPWGCLGAERGFGPSLAAFSALCCPLFFLATETRRVQGARPA